MTTNHAKFCICILLLLRLSFGLYSAAVNSPSPDEPGHLAGGLAIWRENRLDVFKVNPPLLRIVSGIPPALLCEEVSHPKRIRDLTRSEFGRGKLLIHDNQEIIRTVFFLSRSICLIFPLAMTYTCALWANALYGHRSAVLAAALCSLSPMILGHGSLVSPDSCGAAMGVLAMYRLRIWQLEPTPPNVVLLGISAGFALSAKFTWLPVLPVVAVIVIVAQTSLRDGLRSLRDLGAAAIISLLVVNAIFGFDRPLTPLGNIHLESNRLRSNAPEQPTQGNRFSGTLLGRVPCPLPIEYLQGIDLQIVSFESQATSRKSYLIGEWKLGGWWYYYLFAFVAKEPLPCLILLFWSIVRYVSGTVSRFSTRVGPTASAEHGGRQSGSQLREHLLLFAPLISILILVSSETSFNRHLRYILLCYPFLYILVSSVAVSSARSVGRVLFLLIILQFVDVSIHAGQWISYFNVAFGGSHQGHRWLAGSNLEWGQDLYRLKQWQEQAGSHEPLYALLSAGAYDPADLGLEYQSPAPFIMGWPDVTNENGTRGPQPGWHVMPVSHYFLGAENLNLLYMQDDGRVQSPSSFEYLRTYPVKGRIGDTLILLHFTAAEALAARTALLSDEAKTFHDRSNRPP